MEEKGSLLTVDELAQRLRVKNSWVYRFTRTDEIPCVRVGKYRRFFLSDVLEWLDRRGEERAAR